MFIHNSVEPVDILQSPEDYFVGQVRMQTTEWQNTVDSLDIIEADVFNADESFDWGDGASQYSAENISLAGGETKTVTFSGGSMSIYKYAALGATTIAVSSDDDNATGTVFVTAAP